MTETWKESVMESLLNFEQAPESFIPGCFPDSTATGPAITKYRGLFEPQNTPFKVGISLEKKNMVRTSESLFTLSPSTVISNNVEVA